MIYLLYGFAFGFIIPYIARRFSKFMPATLGVAIYKILTPVKICKNPTLKKRALLRKYFYRSILIGVITAIWFYLIFFKFGTAFIGIKLLFVWLLILLAEIDKRMMLLPDIITVPIILIGTFASLIGASFADPLSSSLGGLFGYFLPVIASLFIIWKNKDALGGGDIKLLAGIGVWCGVSGLLFTIILASISFGIYSIIKSQRSGAFGPWLTYSTLTILLLLS